MIFLRVSRRERGIGMAGLAVVDGTIGHRLYSYYERRYDVIHNHLTGPRLQSTPLALFNSTAIAPPENLGTRWVQHWLRSTIKIAFERGGC